MIVLLVQQHSVIGTPCIGITCVTGTNFSGTSPLHHKLPLYRHSYMRYRPGRLDLFVPMEGGHVINSDSEPHAFNKIIKPYVIESRRFQGFKASAL